MLNLLFNAEMLEETKCEPKTASKDVCCPKLNEMEAVPDVDVRFGDAPAVCQTPNRQPGVCISVFNCNSAYQLLLKKKSMTLEELEFLKQSQCGFENRSPLVCCASGATPVESKQKNQAIHANLLPTFEKCGASLSDRIVGGRNAKVDEYPWLALIEYVETKTKKQGFHCGGSLITDHFTLTAAHCLLGKMIPSPYKP
jgi:Regulatory CLIP domain of proteinases/Trypsin